MRDASGREVYEGGRSTQALVELKLLMAEDLKREAVLTPAEELVARFLSRRKEKARIQVQAEAERTAQIDRERRESERRERVQALLARAKQTVYAQNGQRLTGTPVVENEYQILPHGTWVVTVEHYDSEGGVCGQPIEHFLVQKSAGGRVHKQHVRAVTSHDPSQSHAAAVKRGEVPIEIDGELHVVSLYSRSDIDALHGAGLNGGARVGLFPANRDGTITVYTVAKKGVREVGKYQLVVI